MAQITWLHPPHYFTWTQFCSPTPWPEKSSAVFCWHLFSAHPFLTRHLQTSYFYPLCERRASLLTLKRTTVSPQLCGIIYYLFLPCVINGDSLCPASAGLTCRQWTLRRSQRHASIRARRLCKHTHRHQSKVRGDMGWRTGLMGGDGAGVLNVDLMEPKSWTFERRVQTSTDEHHRVNRTNYDETK